MKIALVMPYYGVLPPYFSFFLRSLEGKGLDVLFFSDLAVEKCPSNFKPIKMPFDEFKRLAVEKLGVPVRLDTPRRLCDFKPMYGVLFAEELKGYDYWAFGDCDVMYGRRFDAWIEKVVAGDYEVATVQQDFVAGPFTLVKNCEKCNRFFEKAAGWRDILLQPKTMAFDELGENWFRKWLGGHRSYEQLRREQGSFSAVCWRERDAGLLRFLCESVVCEETLKRGE